MELKKVIREIGKNPKELQEQTTKVVKREKLQKEVKDQQKCDLAHKWVIEN